MHFVRKKLHRYARSGRLYAVRKGIYAKDRFYDRFELATSIFTPSYVSLESVLGPAGITSPYPGRIHVVSYLTRNLNIDGQFFCVRKIRDSILNDSRGIDVGPRYSAASWERAFLDLLYLSGECDFYNLAQLNWDEIGEMLPIYGGNGRMERLVHKLQNEALRANW
jgi:hypothetical protein